MTVITKAELARELRISKARVSQYVAQGLPALENGRLDREAALAWIADNVEPGRAPGRGAWRAAGLAGAHSRALPDFLRFAEELEPADCGAAIMGVSLAYRGAAVGAVLAAHAGVPMRTVYSLYCRLKIALAAEVLQIMRDFGFEPGASNEDAPIWLAQDACRPDWAYLAEVAGEPCDLPAWKAHLSAQDSAAVADA